LAIAVTGTAALAATTKQTVADGAYLDSGTPRLHIVDAEGRHLVLRVASDGPGNNLGAARTPFLVISSGGQQADVLCRLSQSNCNDILATLATFANTGTLS
jgi:hypothetical protein